MSYLLSKELNKYMTARTGNIFRSNFHTSFLSATGSITNAVVPISVSEGELEALTIFSSAEIILSSVYDILKFSMY